MYEGTVEASPAPAHRKYHQIAVLPEEVPTAYNYISAQGARVASTYSIQLWGEQYVMLVHTAGPVVKQDILKWLEEK